jgi:hydroxyacylglutathione hydrolase
MRIGMDNFYGYVDANLLPTEYKDKLLLANMADIADVKNNSNAAIIDVRGISEYNSGHIQGAKHLFVGTLLNNLDKVPKEKPVIIHCQGGDRSAIAYSLLLKNGYTNIKNYSGGINEWVKEQQPIVS